MIEEGLYKALKDDSDVGSKVQNGSVYHIYPLRLPEGVDLSNGYAVTYTEITQALTYPLVRQSLFQINAFAKTFENARELASDIDDALNDLSETKLGGEFAVNYVKFINRQALFDEQSNLWYYAIEVTIKF